VEQQLQRLSNSGHVIFPRPWQVQLVGELEIMNEDIQKVVDVSSEILTLLQERGSMRIIDIMKHFEAKAISHESVESSLESLMKKGELFEPSQGTVKIV
jgi:DNA replicative helicase MCM subunit Mcm2 (Cdc46/Mcm family)